MKKHKINMNEIHKPKGICSIWIDNIRLCEDHFQKISDIIRCFSSGSELYFCLYKKDGMYLSKKQEQLYGKEILSFFRNNGKIYPIFENNSAKEYNIYAQELFFCSASNNDATYEIIEKVCPYFLENIIFSPKVDWRTFINMYTEYIQVGADEYLIKNYTDFLFSYVDSGDLSISFNARKYNSKLIRQRINEIMNV